MAAVSVATAPGVRETSGSSAQPMVLRSGGSIVAQALSTDIQGGELVQAQYYLYPRRGDRDGDGIPNRRDRDIDGDGIPNRRDRDIDGDGIPNRYDRTPGSPGPYRGPMPRPRVLVPCRPFERADVIPYRGPPLCYR